LNEAKRSIKLLNKFYIPQIKKEIASVFKKWEKIEILLM
jgi:hypothetical protein